jgi:RNA polymerase sigma-B factor
MSDAASDRMSTAARTDAAEFARYRDARDPALREALVARFLPLAWGLASRYVGRAERDDLEQVAALALLKAIERYDPDRGLAFSSFAVPTILGELRRYFRDHAWSVRVPRDVQELSLRVSRVTDTLIAELGRTPTPAELARRCDATVEQILDVRATATARDPDSLDQPRYDDQDDSAAMLGARDDPEFARVENAAVVDGLLARLPERERRVLQLRFQRELTQAEIGRHLGISQMHVSRIIRRSIDTLHQAAASQPGEPLPDGSQRSVWPV